MYSAISNRPPHRSQGCLLRDWPIDCPPVQTCGSHTQFSLYLARHLLAVTVATMTAVCGSGLSVFYCGSPADTSVTSNSCPAARNCPKNTWSSQTQFLPEASPVAPQPPSSRLSLFPPTLHLPSPLLPPSSPLSASTTTVQPFDCWPASFDRSPAATLSSPPAEQRLGPRVNEGRRRRGNEARKQGKHKCERSKKRRSKARDDAITTSVKSTSCTTDGGQDKTVGRPASARSRHHALNSLVEEARRTMLSAGYVLPSHDQLLAKQDPSAETDATTQPAVVK